jgi:hypothetical protein
LEKVGDLYGRPLEKWRGELRDVGPETMKRLVGWVERCRVGTVFTVPTISGKVELSFRKAVGAN